MSWGRCAVPVIRKSAGHVPQAACRLDSEDPSAPLRALAAKMFRHSYGAARLQTLDQDAPVSVYRVAKATGHGDESMVRRVYGHLGQVRHRAAVVEYRIEPPVGKLGGRLEAPRSVGFCHHLGEHGPRQRA
jgi:hypothetical protein